MGFKKIIDKLEDKLEDYENEMDEDEIPPWYGSNSGGSESSKSTSSETSDSSSGSFTLTEESDQTVIDIGLPGVPEDNIEVQLDENKTLYIEVESSGTVDERTYEYSLSDEEDEESIEVGYENGLLTLTIAKK